MNGHNHFRAVNRGELFSLKVMHCDLSRKGHFKIHICVVEPFVLTDETSNFIIFKVHLSPETILD